MKDVVVIKSDVLKHYMYLNWTIPKKFKVNRGRGERWGVRIHLFEKKPWKPLEIPDRISFNPRKFWNIVWHPLEIPRSEIVTAFQSFSFFGSVVCSNLCYCLCHSESALIELFIIYISSSQNIVTCITVWTHMYYYIWTYMNLCLLSDNLEKLKFESILSL